MAAGSSTRNTKVVGVDSTLIRSKVEPPDELTDEAKEVWRRLVDAVPNNQFNNADFVILGTYCETYATMIKANEHVKAQGEVVINVSGNLVKNPWFSVSQEAASKIASLAIKLRLCPSARQKAEQTKEKPSGNSSTTLGGLIKR